MVLPRPSLGIPSVMTFQEIRRRGPELIFGEMPTSAWGRQGTPMASEPCTLRTARGLHHRVSRCSHAQGASPPPTPRLEREARKTREEAPQ